MKIENNLENKARFFALYWGQEVLIWHYNSGEQRPHKAKVNYCNQCENEYLELTPLSQISDEDAIEVARIFNLGHLSGAVKALVLRLLESLDKDSQATTMFIRSWINVVDYLRSRGYYVGDGTEVEFGWVKLKGGEQS